MTRQAIVTAGVTLASLVLYLLTIAPGITWSNLGADGGDLLSATFTWGVPHPSGYPAYLLILRAFAWVVPVGDLAFRGNLMSAVFAALATGAVFVAASRITLALSADPARQAAGSPPMARWAPIGAAAVAAIGAGAARELWSQATITEVYALNAFFVAVIVAGCAAALIRSPDSGPLTRPIAGALAFALGVGLGNHLTLALAAGPLLVAVVFDRWNHERSIRDLVVLLLPFLAGLAVYMYAPIASSRLPPVNWGHPHTLEGFWWMISGSIYRDYAFGVEPGLLPGRIATWADFFLSQYTVIGLWLGLAGLYALWLRFRKYAVSSALGVVLVSLYAIGYDTPDSYLYLIPAFLVFAIWIAAGVVWLALEIHRYLSTRTRQPRTHIAIAALIAGVAVVVPGFSLYSNASALNLRDDHGARDFASNAVDAAGAGAIVLAADSERVFSLWYQTYVAERDSGVAIVSLPHLQFDWYWDDIRRQFPDRVPENPRGGFAGRVDALVAHNLGTTPIFAASRTRILDKYRLEEDGVIFRIGEAR